MRGNGGAWALGLLTESDPKMERADLRRRYHEVVDAFGGRASDQWWRWCVETAASLGLELKVVDCTPTEAAALAREGAQLTTRLLENESDASSEADWVLIFGDPRNKLTLVRSSDPDNQERHTAKSLRRWLAGLNGTPTLRFVVFDPKRHAAKSPRSSTKPLEPLSRLQKLLQPEWSDIWIVILFAFVVGLLMLATPIAVESLVNTVAFGRLLQPVVVLAILLFIFLAFSGAIRALQTYVVEIIQQRLFARVAADLSFRLPRVQIEKCEQHYMPELVNRFFDIVTVQKASAQILLDGVSLLLGTVIGMTVLAFYHPWLFGFDIFLLVSLALLITVLGRGATQSAVKESKMKYATAGWLEDVARCPVTFRSDGGIDFAMERADHHIKDYLTARQSHFRVLMRQIIFALGLQAIASTVLLGLGGWLVISGELTLGQLVAAELIVTVIVGGFAKLGKHMESFYDLLASVDKLGILFDLPREREDGLLVPGEGQPLAVEAKDVSYVRDGKPLLHDVTFQVPPGGSLALLGASGSGKSKILDILYALRKTTTGHVTINGFDPADIRPDLLRRQVAMVRGVEVFQGTIAENVHLHRPEVSANQVRDALEQVGLLEPVHLLDDSLEATLSSGGYPLSENQCRLLALARAIAGRPGLLLIDGMLDSIPDGELFPLLGRLTQPGSSWTLIVATGREDIAERCDRQQRLDVRSRTSLEPQPA